MVVKGGSQAPITFMGVDSTTEKHTTVLSIPMSVFWRCEPPFTTCFSRRYQRRPLLRFRDSADCLDFAVDDERASHMAYNAFIFTRSHAPSPPPDHVKRI